MFVRFLPSTITIFLSLPTLSSVGGSHHARLTRKEWGLFPSLGVSIYIIYTDGFLIVKNKLRLRSRINIVQNDHGNDSEVLRNPRLKTNNQSSVGKLWTCAPRSFKPIATCKGSEIQA